MANPKLPTYLPAPVATGGSSGTAPLSAPFFNSNKKSLCLIRSLFALNFFALLVLLASVETVLAQTAYVLDQFDPSGTGGNNYASGQITNVWGNWFGTAFTSVSWDSTSDADTSPASGSLKITAAFNGTSNQFAVYNGLNGITPALIGLFYTNFQCDVRFAPGSATAVIGGVATFGHLQFGTSTALGGQAFFGGPSYGVDIAATNSNWVHVSIPIDPVTYTSLQNIYSVLIHIFGPYTSPALNGSTTLWVDNIRFVGPVPVVNNCVVDWNDVHQKIDGFGASSAWQSIWTTAQADLLFSTNSGIVYTDNLGKKTTNNGVGLSLLRTRIAPGGTTVENTIMQMAQARGAKVWSTPWSPAAVPFKSNANVNGGGFLGTLTNYQAYASQLAGYVANMQHQYGVNLYALSVQNEPDARVTTYESCNWTAQQIHDFVPYLYAALTASNVASTKIMLPESQNWQDYSNLAATAMNDPNVAAEVGIVADHNYDGNNGPAQLTKNNYGKSLWQTEVSLLSGSDGSINNGIYYAQRIHLFMTVARVNAWHYWWLISGSGGNQGLLDNNAAITKRLFTLGNYSRFVRPGSYCIGVSNNAFISVSAYQDTNSLGFAIAAINPNSASITQIFNLTHFPAVTSVTPWITSSNLSLAGQSIVSVVDSSFTFALPPLSVTTFTGQGSASTPPTLAPVANRSIDVGFTLMITNTATDANQPPPTLAFNFLNAPTNATLTPLNNTDAVFAWRPMVSQASTTNLITVQVAENGAPNLGATNNFVIVVNPLTLPKISSINVSDAGISLEVDGGQGPDYTLLTSTNLMSGWQVIGITNSPGMPLSLEVSNSAAPMRFYRIQIGP